MHLGAPTMAATPAFPTGYRRTAPMDGLEGSTWLLLRPRVHSVRGGRPRKRVLANKGSHELYSVTACPFCTFIFPGIPISPLPHLQTHLPCLAIAHLPPCPHGLSSCSLQSLNNWLPASSFDGLPTMLSSLDNKQLPAIVHLLIPRPLLKTLGCSCQLHLAAERGSSIPCP